jgi:plastocyanin
MKKLISSENKILMGIVSLLIILVFSTSCTKTNDSMSSMGNTSGSSTGSKGGPGTNEVWIQGMAFTPSTITVSAGTQITWTNKDGVTHTVTSNKGLFDSGSIGSNGTYSFTFQTAGTYSYFCSTHPSMTAKVVVN